MMCKSYSSHTVRDSPFFYIESYKTERERQTEIDMDTHTHTQRRIAQR